MVLESETGEGFDESTLSQLISVLRESTGVDRQGIVDFWARIVRLMRAHRRDWPAALREELRQESRATGVWLSKMRVVLKAAPKDAALPLVLDIALAEDFASFVCGEDQECIAALRQSLIAGRAFVPSGDIPRYEALCEKLLRREIELAVAVPLDREERQRQSDGVGAEAKALREIRKANGYLQRDYPREIRRNPDAFRLIRPAAGPLRVRLDIVAAAAFVAQVAWVARFIREFLDLTNASWITLEPHEKILLEEFRCLLRGERMRIIRERTERLKAEAAAAADQNTGENAEG